MYSDILSDDLSGIHYDILSDLLSDIVSGIYIYILTFCLAFSLACVPVQACPAASKACELGPGEAHRKQGAREGVGK